MDLLTQLTLAAKHDADAAAARLAYLRRVLAARYVDAYRADGTITKKRQAGLGEARMDGLDSTPRIEVTKPHEVASWLAERDPAYVTAAIIVQADRLADALEQLEFGGVTVHEATVTPTDRGLDWLAANTRVDPDPDSTGRWIVNHVERRAEGEVKLGDVPGVIGVKAAPKLVLLPAKEPLSDRIAAEMSALQEQIDGETTEAESSAPATITPATDQPEIHQPGADAPLLEGLTRDQLIQMCRDAGLPVGGNKTALTKRLGDHFASQAVAS